MFGLFSSYHLSTVKSDRGSRSLAPLIGWFVIRDVSVCFSAADADTWLQLIHSFIPRLLSFH